MSIIEPIKIYTLSLLGMGFVVVVGGLFIDNMLIYSRLWPLLGIPFIAAGLLFIATMLFDKKSEKGSLRSSLDTMLLVTIFLMILDMIVYTAFYAYDLGMDPTGTLFFNALLLLVAVWVVVAEKRKAKNSKDS